MRYAWPQIQLASCMGACLMHDRLMATGTHGFMHGCLMHDRLMAEHIHEYHVPANLSMMSDMMQAYMSRPSGN